MLNFQGSHDILWLVGWHEMQWNRPDLRSVLVVEDDTFMKPLVSQILHSLDPALSLDWATSAEEAEQAISRSVPDLLIADCLLGRGRSGMSLWENCRKRWPDLPFLLMTGLGLASLEQLRPTQAAELPEYIQKPFRVDDFRGRVKGLLLP